MTKETLIQMSSQELDKIVVISKVVSKSLKQSLAAELLGVGIRQIRRLVKKYRQHGPCGLASKKRNQSGRPGFSEKNKSEILSLIKTHYHDFGPTLAAEKLEEYHQIQVNKETLRQWMIEHHLWQSKTRRKARIHQSRVRRSCRGELVQIDGSHHDWFEGRANKCCLLVFIDDATSEILHMRFENTETTEGYFKGIKDYLSKHGRPVTWYSDKHSIFRVNRDDMLDEKSGETQFQRAMQQIDIGLICANSPQAKGRVERANKTLQDRLIKEMRLRGISDIESGNHFLTDFMRLHNKRFAVEPANANNAHRPLYHSVEELELILSHQETRKLSKNLEFSYGNKIYQIIVPGKGYRLRHSHVTVCEKEGHVFQIIQKGQSLPFSMLEKQKQQTIIANDKEINSIVDLMLKVDRRTLRREKYHSPAANHAWRRPLNPAKRPNNISDKPNP